MLTLLLLRHAKAVQHVPDGDFARPLAVVGAIAARALGGRLAELGTLPDLALVSASARTRETFTLLEAACGRPLPARIDQGLYDASAGQMRDMLRRIEPDVRALMIVAHNPGIMDLAVALTRDGDPADIERMRRKFPPCSLALLTFPTEDWRDARAGGRLDLFLIPEDLVSPS